MTHPITPPSQGWVLFEIRNSNPIGLLFYISNKKDLTCLGILKPLQQDQRILLHG